MKVEDKYIEDVVWRATKVMRESDDEQHEEHLGFIMQLFRYEAKLSYDDFIHEVTDKCKWLFTSHQLRERFEPFTDLEFLDEYEEENK